MNEVDGLKWCVKNLPNTGSLNRLCVKADEAGKRKRVDAEKRVRSLYRGRFDEFLGDLTNDDRKHLVERWADDALELAHFTYLASASKAELVKIIKLLVLEDWSVPLGRESAKPLRNGSVVAYAAASSAQVSEGQVTGPCPREEDTEHDVRTYAPDEYVAMLRKYLLAGKEHEFRGVTYELPTDPPAHPQTLLLHQQEALSRVAANDHCSGIIHLPTGSGKTRTALALMSSFFERNPRGVVIWATDGVQLIRQSMMRVVELAGSIPAKLTIQWMRVPDATVPTLFDDANVLFATRDTLTKWLGVAAASLGNALTGALVDASAGRSVMVIYDECHGLGAPELQKAWRKFHKRVVEPHAMARKRFRVFGLSATPMPTGTDSHRLLRDVLFPILPGTESARPEWGVLVHKSESMRNLTERRILCPINTSLQESHAFDIPVGVLRKATDAAIPSRLTKGDRSDREWANEFSRLFNKTVMSDPAVLKWLSDQIAAHLDVLGKTIVFCASIHAANELVAMLKRDARVGAGRVTLVHSRMEDPELVEETETDSSETPDAFSAAKQIEQFLSRGNEPCVMVNVGMLTTGFDDPRVRSVVLARLTFSKNLFWQMIGRGLRGPLMGGTPDCHVIDPVRLTDRFEVFEGYRPTVTSGGIPKNDLESGTVAFADAADLAPVVTAQPPTPHVNVELRHIASDVREALKAFLRGEQFDVAEVAKALTDVDLVVEDGTPVFQPASGHHEAGNAFAPTVDRHIIELGERLGADLSWIMTETNQVWNDEARKLVLRTCQVVQEKGILTLQQWQEYKNSRL